MAIAQETLFDGALLDTVAFTDEKVYRTELERVFGRCWLYVGHETNIPNPGDYISNYMGEDSVILVRSTSGKVRVLLNKCLHRGNKVCLFDKGNARSFTCTFHGWQYNTDGKIVGLPHQDDAYLGKLNADEWGLVEVPRVETYAGMIFASWDRDVMPLEAYLGDIRWYLDRLLVFEPLGGMEVIGGRQRFLMPTNWKLLSDNFAGDDYHVGITHASYFKVLAQQARNTRTGARGPLDEALQVCVGYGSGVPHGLGALRTGPKGSWYDSDMALAEELGSEAVDWVTERYRRLDEAYGSDPTRVQAFANANVFPNLSIISSGATFFARGLIHWHPRGPLMTEGVQWCFVEKDAPKVVKQAAIKTLMSGQAAAGMIAPDDSENFERTTDNLMSHFTRKQPFHYGMGPDRDHPGLKQLEADGLPMDGLPGLLGPFNWEANQRQFYRYWSQLMARER